MPGEGTGPVIRAPWPPSLTLPEVLQRSAPVYQLMREKQCQACCKMLSAFPWMQTELIPTEILSVGLLERVVRFKSGLEKVGQGREKGKGLLDQICTYKKQEIGMNSSFLFGRTMESRMFYLKETEWLPVLNIRQNFCQDHVPPILYFSNCISLWVNSLFSNIAFLALISMKSWI